MSSSRRLAHLPLALLFVACSTPDPVRLPPGPPPGGGGGGGIDAGGVWDGSFDADAGEGEVGAQCGEPPVKEGDFSRAALLEAAADCAAWHDCRFEAVAVVLRDKIHALVEAPSDGALQAARVAWRDAMVSWSENELFQFGPVANRALDEYHGEGIRNLIYAWPSQSRCRVEEQVANQRYATDGVGKVLIDGRGLFAIEYLLFYSGQDHACSASSQTAATWATLDPDELARRKYRYAEAVADDLVAQAQKLVDVYDPLRGNFKAKLVAGEKYGSLQEALNVVAWSLVYIEREVKDWKLGIPAGYNTGALVSGPESPYAGIGIDLIRANLRGFRSLFQGCGASGEGLGFDDWLAAAGHTGLATELMEAWEDAVAVADASPPLHQASGEELDALYRAVKKLTDLLKADLFGPGSPLNLKLPATVEGDTD